MTVTKGWNASLRRKAHADRIDSYDDHGYSGRRIPTHKNWRTRINETHPQVCSISFRVPHHDSDVPRSNPGSCSGAGQGKALRNVEGVIANDHRLSDGLNPCGRQKPLSIAGGGGIRLCCREGAGRGNQCEECGAIQDREAGPAIWNVFGGRQSFEAYSQRDGRCIGLILREEWIPNSRGGEDEAMAG